MIISRRKMRLFLIAFLFFTVTVKSFAQEGTPILDDSSYIYRSLKDASANPEKVFRLNLSKSKLDTFPPEIFAFKNLTELDLSKNKMEEIPPQIGTLIHL